MSNVADLREAKVTPTRGEPIRGDESLIKGIPLFELRLTPTLHLINYKDPQTH